MRAPLLVALTCALPATAVALTQPIAGAVSLPDGADLRAPFQDGRTYLVSSGYGPNGGSSLHRNTNVAGRANDHYALDMVMPGEPNNGLGEPVVAVAPGEVVLAGWATAGWGNYGLRVILRLDLGDGHAYHVLYAHLNAITVEPGQRVARGQVIGELGDSCDGDHQVLACPSFGAHLHFAIHRDSEIGGSGTGGSHSGNAAVPEPLGGEEDLHAGLEIVAGGGGGEPPPPCGRVPPEGGIVEDDGPCFRRGGNARFWHPENAGHGGRLLWTVATADPQRDNWGRWTLELADGGDYTLSVFTEQAFAQSRRARYVVRAAGDEHAFVLDQGEAQGWRRLGDLRFAAGGDQWIELADNTGEAVGEDRKLVFDAVRLQPAGEEPPPPPPPTDASPPPPPPLTDAGEPPPPPPAGDAAIDEDARLDGPDAAPQPARDGGALPSPDVGHLPGPPGAAEAGSAAPDDADDAAYDGGGCGLAARGVPAPAFLALLLLPALAARRRR